MKTLNSSKLKASVGYIDQWLEFNFANSRVTGMSVAILHKDKIVYSRAFGFANLENQEELTTKHIFRIASHSKTFTSTAIMRLNEQGKLEVDDPVSKYLLWFKSTQDPRLAKITVRQLLGHQAGISRDGDSADFWQLMYDYPDENGLKEYIHAAKLVYAPNKQFKYSNLGFSYLGLLIEAVSGKTYHQYVTDNIIKPLGLKSTGPDIGTKLPPLIATGYGLELFGRKRQQYGHPNTRAMAAATGFYATPEDACKYFAGHFIGDTRLVTDASKRQMQNATGKPFGTKERYGLGMVHYPKKGWKLHGHSGGFPGFLTNTQFDTERQLAVAVFTNNWGGEPKGTTRSIIDIIDVFQQETPNRSSIKDLSRFAGRFYVQWGPTDIIVIGGKILALSPRHKGDINSAQVLSVVDDKTLKIEEAGGYESPGELIRYHFDKSGKVTHIINGGKTMYSWEEAVKKSWF